MHNHEENTAPELVRGKVRVYVYFVYMYIVSVCALFCSLPTVRNTLREIELQNDYCNGCGLTDHGCGMTLL